MKCFQRTEALITTDLSDDSLICPMQGIKDYTIPAVPANIVVVEDETDIVASTKLVDDENNESDDVID